MMISNPQKKLKTVHAKKVSNGKEKNNFNSICVKTFFGIYSYVYSFSRTLFGICQRIRNQH
jgi:hypothetical protein